ncbi:MAG: anaerobic ribonucleoside-triphosphate reductase activating protein [Brevinematales bacterium]|nr:anaerobic ribonucleoside-triphosphate reductase activating protein [Brevinematales bacterium]
MKEILTKSRYSKMFKGIQKVSLIDYPGYIATTLFTGGCNFDCFWCHNRSLVETDKLSLLPDVPEETIKSYLLARKGKIEGVCITGGEPTLWGKQLAEFMSWCKEHNFRVKLDTNGYLPEVLLFYIENKLLDFIAMDIKNTFDKYPETVGVNNLDIERIKKSIEIIKNSGIKHQFRSTIVPVLVEKDKLEILVGEKIVFQEYVPIEKVS